MAAESPSVSGVSGRYATALFELARDEKSIDAIKADLDRFEAMLADSADLKRLVRSPVFSAEVQMKALAAVLDKAGISGTSAVDGDGYDALWERNIAVLLAAHPRAQRFFDTLAPGYRRDYLRWITEAKKEETRERRLKEAIRRLELGWKTAFDAYGDK